MIKLIIFGTGKSSDIVVECLNDNAEVMIYLDNNSLKQNTFKNKVKIVFPNKISEFDYDYVIIASTRYREMEEQLLDLDVDGNKIISFFDYQNCRYEEYDSFLNTMQAKFKAYEAFINIRLDKIENSFRLFSSNFTYEIADDFQKNNFKFPIVLAAHDAIERILNEKCSMIRFGDGEFEIMFGRNRPRFQKCNDNLKERLLGIINNKDKNLLTCIADNYGSLNRYNFEAANEIRAYLTPEVREEHMKVLDLDKVYYDAYITRPYSIMRDKSHVKEDFDKWKLVWDSRDCVIIEGEYSRLGVGNNLFDNAVSLERILCPAENAWDSYSAILDETKKIGKNKLIMISLGPAATVLAYDLYKLGYQALDIGHIDIEYEWYLRNVKKPVSVKGKYVNEVDGGNNVEFLYDEKYEQQIIARIF